VLQEMSGSQITAPDPFAEVFPLRQPDARFDAFIDAWIADLRRYVTRPLSLGRCVHI